MSRSNAQVARNLRENESMRTRKAILKAGGSARGQAAAALEAARADEAILKKVSDLKNFTKKSKANKKQMSDKSEWMQGEMYLRNQASRVESDMASLLQKIVVSALTCGGGPRQGGQDIHIASLGQHVEQYESERANREENQKILMVQLQEIKSMLQRTKNAVSAAARGPTDDATMSAAEEKRNVAVAVFADVLIKVKDSHAESGKALAEEAKRLQTEVDASVSHLCELQAEYRQLRHSSRVAEELQAKDTDTATVLALLDEWRQKLYSCDDELHTTLEVIAQDRELIHSQYCNKCEVDPSKPYGSWSEEDHNIFVKEIKRSQTQGLQRHKLSAALASQLPHMTHAQISSHEDWYRSMRSLQDRRRAATQAHETNREELLRQARESLQNAREKAEEEERIMRERERHEKARAELHLALNIQRAERVKEMESRLAEIEQLRMQADEENRKEEERRAEEVRQKKALVEKFRADREAFEAAQRRQAEEAAAAEAAEKKRRVEEARPHVEQREALRLKKIEEQRRKEKKHLEEEARRLDILNKLAEQVPYWDALQAAESKLDHVTAAVEAQKYQKPEEVSRGHLSMNGFTDQKLFKDARFRLGLALREAGVHQSAAAAAVISSLHPRQQAPW